jgi:hypothetical protein
MQPVVRSIFVGLLAIAGLTACGDKVTVPPPTTTLPSNVVRSVTVSPPTAQLNVGDKITLGVSVDADQGVTDRTVKWTTSNATVASVGTDGTVNALSPGTASITATSNANPAVSGSSVITVAAVVVATVTIGQINQTVCTPTCTSVPAVLTNVSNQLDVTLNVDQGSQKLSTVQLLMNCGGADTVVGSQSISAPPPAGAAGASESAAPITISFNTAAFNPATGVVAFKNGACTLKAKGITTSGTQTAVSQTPITLNNVDFVSVGPMTTTPTGSQNATANDAGGLLWHAGSVTATAVPIIYTANRTIATASISLVNVSGGNAQGPGNALKVIANNGTIVTMSGLTPANGVITAQFPNSSATGNVAGVTAAGVGVSVNTVDNNGNAGPSITATSATATGSNSIRLDNRAPDITSVPPIYNPNTQNTTGGSAPCVSSTSCGWVGTAFIFSTASGALTINASTTADSVAGAGGVFGVDKNTIATQSSPTGAGTFTTFASPTNLAETSSAAAYDLRLVICDALNNCATSGVLGHFGIDLTPPFIKQTAGPTDMQVFNIGTGSAPPAKFDVEDTSKTPGISASGAQTVAGVPQVLVTLLGLKPFNPTPANTSQTVCDIGTPTGSQPAITCKSGALVNETNVPTTGTSSGTTVMGQYTLNVTAIDQAGNTTAFPTIHTYNDQGAPVVSGGVQIPQNITTGTAFTSGSTDSMDVAAGNGYLHYPASGGLSAQFRIFQGGTASPAGVTFDNVLVRVSTTTTTMSSFYRTLQNAIDGLGPKPNTAGIRAIDAAGNLSAAQVVSLPATNISGPPPGAPFRTAGDSGITTWGLTSPPSPLPALTADSTVSITAEATALSLSSASPFSGAGGNVCFYYNSPKGTEGGVAGPGGAATGNLVLIACQPQSVTNIVGSTRFFDYTITWTVPESLKGTSFQLFAIGNNTSTDGLITAGRPVSVSP